jgi:drug/metabolite transporter (DMT)-like permease
MLRGVIPVIGTISPGMLGLLAATTAAFFWSIATVLYQRVGRVMPPVRLNLVKGIAAILVLGAAVGWQAWRTGNNPLPLPLPLLGIMAVSGVIGIGGGDTCFFAALNRIGPRRALLMFMLAPALTAVVAWPLLGQTLSLMQAAGIALTCGGIAWVIAERTPGKGGGHVDGLGLMFGVGAAVCQAAGALMSRYVFDQFDYGAAPSALVRVVAGTAVLVFLLPLDKYLRVGPGNSDSSEASPSRASTWSTLAVAMLLGTVLGIWLQQTAFKMSSNLGVASTLLSTSPLWILPIAAAAGERITLRAVLGAVIGILGIALLLGVVG